MDYDDGFDEPTSGFANEHGYDSDEEILSSGFQIVGEDGGELSDEDLLSSAYAGIDGVSLGGTAVSTDSADRLLASDEYERIYGKKAQIADYRSINLDGDTESYGKVTGSDFLLNKIQKMDYGIQAAFKDVLQGKILSYKAGIDGLSMLVAVEEFERATGQDRKDLAGRIKLDKSVQSTRFEGNLRTVQSMLSNIEADMGKGPGSKLLGDSLTAEREERVTAKEAKAYATIDRLVEMTKGGITGNVGEDLYTRQVRDQIYRAAIDSPVGPTSLNWAPLPNELKQFGSVLTMAPQSGSQGTAYNRTTFSSKFPETLNRSDVPMYDEIGRIVPNTLAMAPELAKEMADNMLSGNRNSEGLSNYLRNFPSLKESYMPKPSNYFDMDSETKALWRIDRDAEWEVFSEELIDARRTLSSLARTNIDESRGNQTRLNAFGSPEGEQQSRASAIDAAFRSGVSGEAYAGQLDETRSELSDFLEEVPGIATDAEIAQIISGETPISNVEAFAGTDLGAYHAWIADNMPPEQGSDEWFRQRVGVVTASQASKLTGGKGTVSLAENMALEALGMKPEFRKNATMQRGNDLEEKAKNSFLRFYADTFEKGITWEEAYFETRDDLPGFGVSPDGRLFNEDGSSAGLLEIKVLNQKNLEGALVKYTKQMQLQMAVSGESVTHFYALDAEGSGDFVYEAVYADAEIQEELISAGNMALELKETMTSIQDVEESRMARITSKQPRRKKTSSTEGQQDAYRPPSGKIELATAWEPSSEVDEPEWMDRFSREIGLTNDGEKVTEKTSAFAAAAKKMEKEDAKEAMLSAEDFLLNASGQQSTRQKKKAKAEATAERTMAKAELAAIDEQSKKESKEETDQRKMVMEELKAYEEANKMAKEALKNTTKEVQGFRDSVKRGAAILAELGGVVIKGNESAMNEVRFAATTGMDVESVRGLREALEDGGMTTESASRVMQSAAAQTRTAQDYQAGSEAWAGLMEFRAKSSIDSVKNIDFGSLKNYRSMDPQQRVAWANNIAKGMPANERHVFLNRIDMSDLATNITPTERLSGARSEFDAQGARDTAAGITDARQVGREVIEVAGTIQGDAGYAAGGASVAAEAASGILSSTTGNALLNAATGGIGAGIGTGAVLSANAALKGFTVNLAKAGKGLGALGAIAAAATAGYAVGTAIYEGLEGTDAQDVLIEGVGGGINTLMAAMGNEDALAIRQLGKIDEPSAGESRSARRAAQRSKTEVNTTVNVAEDGSVEIETEVDGDKTTSDHPSTKSVGRRRRRR